MDVKGKQDLIWRVEVQRGRRSQVLEKLRIPRSTYYKWLKGYRGDGLEGLTKRKPLARRVWNRLMAGERERVLEIARLHPELSSRLLAVKMTDEEAFSVSESTVYRILRENNLIYPRPLPEMPAQEQWRHKTTRPDELWQCDGTGGTTSSFLWRMTTPGRFLPMLLSLTRRLWRYQTCWS